MTRSEYITDGELSKALVPRLAALFAGFEGTHGTHGEPVQRPADRKWEIKGTARTIKGPPTPDLWDQHVAGLQPLGVCPIREGNKCSWGSVDIDLYDSDLLDVIESCEKLHLPLVPIRSKSGGLHLAMFLTEPVPARDVKAALEHMAGELGYAGQEVFPKQTQILVERSDSGSWIIVPYFGSTYGGKLREQVGLRADGSTMGLEEFVKFAENARITPEQLEKWRIGRGRPDGRGDAPRRLRGKESAGDYSDGPPCLQNILSNGPISSGGNTVLFHAGVYFKKALPDSWQKRLESANAELCSPTRSLDELHSMTTSLSKKQYDYKCKEEPIKGHCNAEMCRTRRFGVGDANAYPKLTGLSFSKTDEGTVWFVSIEGIDDRLEIPNDDLYDYKRFSRVCMSKLQRVFLTMKQDAWLKVIAEAMIEVTEIPVDEDCAPNARIIELIESFLVNRNKSMHRDDLLNGRPYDNETEGRYEFQLKDLVKFLDREMGANNVPGRQSLVNIIRKDLGGDGGDRSKTGGPKYFYNIGGKGILYFYVPHSRFTPIPALEPPPYRAITEEVM